MLHALHIINIIIIIIIISIIVIATCDHQWGDNPSIHVGIGTTIAPVRLLECAALVRFVVIDIVMRTNHHILHCLDWALDNPPHSLVSSPWYYYCYYYYFY